MCVCVFSLNEGVNAACEALLRGLLQFQLVSKIQESQADFA